MSLSVIVPTLGRPTLGRTLVSVAGQLEPVDELLVIADTAGDVDRAQGAALAVTSRGQVLFAQCREDGSQFGNAQRDVGMEVASGTHLLFVDDDDVYLPGALDQVRVALELNSNSAHIFRARWGPGHHAHGTELWHTQSVRAGNIATPMVVLPNRPYRRSWLDGNVAGAVSDFEFLGEAIADCGAVWHDEVIATVRPGV